MFKRNKATPILSAAGALVLCTMVTDVALAAPPTLKSVAVTPTTSSISVGQKQFFRATGTFSDGSTHALGPAVADIAPGWMGTCVLLTRGGVKCWGYNRYGQLGDGSTANSLTPRRVKGITNATALGLAPYSHNCALLADGTVKCWGNNDTGQLGNGTMNNSAVPVAVTGINSATAVAASVYSSCALLADGSVQCWGGNSSLPVSVAGISTATALAVGHSHSCALLASGAVQCWGSNDYGQMGNGTTDGEDYTTPVTVVGIHGATAIAAGLEFTCALLASGTVQCWGQSSDGQLGNGSYERHSSIPVPVALTGVVVAIAAGGNHACAVLSSGAAQCWGSNSWGQLGNGLMTTQSSSTPVRVSGINAPVKLAAGNYHTCALLADGAMRCWGLNVNGQLGNRRTSGYTPNRWPQNVLGTPGVVWQSSDPAKATILGSGRATGRVIGNSTITATTAGYINDNALLTVK